jgi:hypothetical protein
MITEIPTASEFQDAGLNQLYLAWQIAMQAMRDYEEAEGSLADEDGRAERSAEYWAKSQPALANAFGLIQQAMEMALKGRIASISPFLLISRDPKDWPKRADSTSVPFSEFRTLDAADLVKVHNAVSAEPLDEVFCTFWDNVRRDRNKIMHSLSPKSFAPTVLVRAILIAAQSLFSEVQWPQRLLDLEADDKYAAYGFDDSTQNAVMAQIDRAIRHLTPAENRLFFGYDVKRRSYLCPKCHDRANRDWQLSWPTLAQFPSKSRGAKALHCVVCDETVEVERVACTQSDCQGDVIYDGTCLTCVSSQDNPRGFRSGLADEQLELRHCYDLIYRHGSLSLWDVKRFADDNSAKEHARLALLAAHLTNWETVTIRHETGGGDDSRRVLGAWVRAEDALLWQPGVDHEFLGYTRAN